MRWFYIILVAFVASMIQTTAGQIFWFPTSLGWIGPIFPIGAAVFAILYARQAVDVALAGWIFGLALELPLGGETSMGLLPVLFAAVSAVLFKMREAFYRDRLVTQMILGFVLALLVYQAWAMCQAVLPGGLTQPYWRVTLQMLVVAVYTGLLTPSMVAMLKPLQRVLWTVPSTQR